MAKSKSSKQWLQEHESDFYVKQARDKGYRSRAAYKLLELQKTDRLIKPGDYVVDLGAAPGGWSQVAAELVGKKGKVVALDRLNMLAIKGVHFIHEDFTEKNALNLLSAILLSDLVDVVISDMAPNISGNKSVDQPKSLYLAELASSFAVEQLKPGGSFIVKLFQGSGVDEYADSLKEYFGNIKFRKPDSSKSQSREIYLVAKNKK